MDKKIELGLAWKAIAAQLFSLIYKGSDCGITTEGGTVEDNAIVESLAADFTNKMPELEFSPAEIMSFLVEHRHAPCTAVENVQQWITGTREERARVKRAGSWVLHA